MGRKGRGVDRVNIPPPAARKVQIVRLVPVHHVQYECTCWECGRGFTADRPDARYHSDACRQKAYRKRQARRSHLLNMQAAGEQIFDKPLR